MTVDSTVGLPLSNTGVSAVAPTDAVKELVGCRTKGAPHRETIRQKVEEVTSTHLGVLVPIRLLDESKSRNGIRRAPASHMNDITTGRFKFFCDIML